jgi:hypothetical protein
MVVVLYLIVLPQQVGKEVMEVELHLVVRVSAEPHKTPTLHQVERVMVVQVEVLVVEVVVPVVMVQIV